MLQPITRPLIRPLCQSITGALGGGFSPIGLFTGTDKGYIYDNNDLSSFYLDSAGTTPATVNGLVGLQLDKSKGLALGAEILTNGDFATDTVWIKGAGWTIGSGVATGASASTDLYTPPSGAYVEGRTYRVQITLATVTSGSLRVWIAGNFGPVISTAGQHTFNIMAGPNNFMSILGSSFVGTIDAVSVKELPGNHRYQTTTGSKPILRGTPVGSNLVTNGDFASGTGWTLGTGWAITGGQLVATATTGIASRTVALTGGNVYRLTVGTNTANLQIRIVGGTGQSITFLSGVGGVAYFTYTAGAGNTFEIVANGTTTGVVDNVEIVDVSASAVTAPYGIQYDGIDDFLQTASVDFTATDKMAVVMGVRKLSDAAVGMVVELSANINLNNGAFYITAPSAAGTFEFSTKGTLQVVVPRSPFNAPITAVLAMTSNSAAPTFDTRVNGSASATSTSSHGTGNYGNYALFFGRRGGASIPYNGLDFGGICVNKTLTASQLSSAERWTASRTGVTL